MVATIPFYILRDVFSHAIFKTIMYIFYSQVSWGTVDVRILDNIQYF